MDPFTLGHSVEDDPGGSTATFDMLTCSCTQELPFTASIAWTLAYTMDVYTSVMSILVIIRVYNDLVNKMS